MYLLLLRYGFEFRQRGDSSGTMPVSHVVFSARSHTSMTLVAMRSSIALGLVLTGLSCLVGYSSDDSPKVASDVSGGAQPAESAPATPGHGMTDLVAAVLGMADPAAQVRTNPIELWNVWGPSWGKSGFSALSPGVETRIRPTPGDVSFSWGTDRPRCLVWKAYSAPDGFINFYSEDVLPGVTKMVVEDAAGRWAGAATYANTYLHTAKSRDVDLVVESGQPVVIWLNGTRLTEQDGGPFPMHLNTGWNRLLIKVLSPSSTRGVPPVYPTAGQPGNWTLRASISLPGGGPVPRLRVQCEDPERNSPSADDAAVPVRYLSTLRGPEDRRPLFVRGESTDLTLTILAAAGSYEHFPANPHDNYEGEAWTYAAPPGPPTTSADSNVSLDQLKQAAAKHVAVSLFDFDGKRVLADHFPLDFRESAEGGLVCTVSLYRGSLPMGHYTLTTDFIDSDGRIQARDHEHAVAVVRGPVDVSRDVTSRRLSCIGHWLAVRPNAFEKLEWLHRVGVTQHQKLCQGWNVWGVKHDGEGNVTIGDAPVIDDLLDKAEEVGIRVVGDLTFGYERPDLKREAGQKTEEQNTNTRPSQVEDLARGIRLVPYGARPLPPYGTPDFEKTLHDYAHAVVSRYKDRVKLWCGDNEVDNVGAVTPAVAAVYAHASRILYDAVKEADPEAEFITASLVRRSTSTDELLRRGYARFSDHVDVHAHPYRAPRISDPLIGNSHLEGHGVLLPYLAEGTENACSVYYGEVSSPLAHAANGATGQAEGVLKQLGWTLKHPIVKSLAYLSLYDNAACLGFCNLYGDPLPANNAINVASHLLDGRPLLDDLPGLPDNIEQICVAGGDERQTLMLWSQQSQTALIPCHGTEVDLIDLLGRTGRLSVTDGNVAVHVTPTPQLIRARFRAPGTAGEGH